MTAEHPPTTNPHLLAWVEEMARLTRPQHVAWCDGSYQEKQALTRLSLEKGILLELNQERLPGCYLHRSDPSDVARVEQLTFICTPTKEEAGPTNNWMEPSEAYRKLGALFDGAMAGRTLYVVPYLMGPFGSPLAKVGIELTDSPYVVLNMGEMTRMGAPALAALGDSNDFNRGLHSLGDLSPERRFICHFPQDNTVWSIGSGYGGNVLLGKKCLALRIGSYLGRHEGWLAEHMLILGMENPDGETSYVAAAFPSQCGKTNFAMMIPPSHFRHWRIWTVGDDIAWMRAGPDGRLWAINPEAGYFGVVPGSNYLSNPNAMRIISHDTLYTNVALASDGTVWWEGKDGPRPEQLIDWKGHPWTLLSKEKAAHPNSRFTSPMWNNPALSPHADDPKGVPISAIIFGGRRATTVPLVMESFGWEHGVYLGATMASETTAAAAGAVGVVRRDPMAMLPFCGYDVGDYLQHWIDYQHRLRHPPKIFMVNWFRRDGSGKFLWPGFGENMRVLRWMIDRCEDRAAFEETPVGRIPKVEDLDLGGLHLDHSKIADALSFRAEEWRAEVEDQKKFFDKIARTLPRQVARQWQETRERLQTRPELEAERAASFPAP